ncbi:MAG: NAD(P)-dependent oxidoreductase [Paludibacteraceae bacterium]|jgi:lactate dehydrogenase-like 2-hydroxyacid dehydrogenase|nr:NAD(P)-dependent oxidoreductase [Paludibacteraceae bacterium]
MKIIIVTTQLPKDGFKILNADFKVIFPGNATFQRKELLQLLPSADVLISAFNYKIDRELIESSPNLQLIANFGVGFNNVDIQAATDHHILVTNTPDPVIEPTAEHAMNLMLAVARRTAELDRKLRETDTIEFGVMTNLGKTLYGKTLGIIGMGNIGQALARRAIACGMKIVYTKRTPLNSETEKRYQAEYLPFEKLLQTADVISLHTPYTAATHHLIDEREFSLMKKGCIVINTARGAIINEQALVNNLTNGKLFGAGLDVFEFEPKISPQLRQLDNVVLAPHTGTATIETRLEMAQTVAQNILYFYNHDSRINRVN